MQQYEISQKEEFGLRCSSQQSGQHNAANREEKHSVNTNTYLHSQSNRDILWVLNQALYPGDSHVQIVH